MGFEIGNECAKNAHIGKFVKDKYLRQWEKIFDKNPVEKLTKLAEENYVEFLRLGIAAMPKDHKVDANITHNIPPEQLKSCVDFVLDFFASKRNQQQNQTNDSK